MRWFFVILCLLFSSPSMAQSSVEKRDAVELVEKGNIAYEAGDYDMALVLFRRAFKSAPDARILYRIGATYELLGNYQRAREHLELYLRQSPSSEYKERILARIEELRLAEGNQSFLLVRSVPEGAEVYLGGSDALGVTPIRLPVHPGLHLLRVKAGDRQVERQVMVGRSETVSEVLDFGGSEKEAFTSEADEIEVPIEEPAIESQNVLRMSHVWLKPPAVLNALGWGGVIGGFWMGVFGAVFGDARLIGGGLAIMGLGGYTIFVHDWTNQLPDAPISEDLKAWSLEVRVPF